MTQQRRTVIFLLTVVPAFLCLVSTGETVDAPGTIAGRAVFEGSVPPARQLKVDKDMDHCMLAAGEVQDVVVGADGALSGVVVEVKGLDGEWQHPEGGYVIRQKGCRFHPEFMVVPDGAELTIYNEDPVLHNVNTGQFNIAQPGGESYVSKRKIAFQGRSFIHVTCNVHGWMEAWIYVARSSFFAVTGADGSFRIDNVPPGTYKVSARHPNLRSKRFEVTVESGQTVEEQVIFSARQ